MFLQISVELQGYAICLIQQLKIEKNKNFIIYKIYIQRVLEQFY